MRFTNTAEQMFTDTKLIKDPRPGSYIPPKQAPKEKKLWQPTWPDYTPALFPYWGKVKTFMMKTGDLKAKPPIEYSERS